MCKLRYMFSKENGSPDRYAFSNLENIDLADNLSTCFGQGVLLALSIVWY